MLEYIMPSIKHRSISTEDDLRVKMARIQLQKFEEQKREKKNKDKTEIAKLVNAFLKQLGITIDEKFDNEITVKSEEEKTKGRISYFEIKKSSGIKHKEDIVWIKFNKGECISVVGVGCDIYFTQRTKEETSAGKINTFLKQEWDEKFVLVFPLIGIEKLKFNRSDIESGIGNYLIANDVPILDYYSHNY